MIGLTRGSPACAISTGGASFVIMVAFGVSEGKPSSTLEAWPTPVARNGSTVIASTILFSRLFIPFTALMWEIETPLGFAAAYLTRAT